MEAAWTVKRVLEWAAGDLRARACATPRLDAELLLASVLGCDRLRLVVEPERALSPGELAAYRELHKRRRKGEPVAYLRGEREFYGRPFRVDARVLVPRPETELLVETAMARTRHLSLSARVLDLCTGSGCVAITLKKERPTTRVFASDVSADALAVAVDNAVRLGAFVGFVRSDLYDELGFLRGKVDLITANPPYIADAEMAALPVDVRDFEPPLALAAGADGLAVTRRIVAGAPALLTQGGILALEVEAGAAAAVRGLFERARFDDLEVRRDYAGHERVVSGRRPSLPPAEQGS
jgi:release factor glutamine methyltransferase